MKTKYWAPKQDGYLFSRCDKDDQDPSVEDGRFVREWTYGTDKGTTLGYQTTSIEGKVESALVKSPNNKDLYFNIGLQDDDGAVNVLVVELYDGHTLSVVQALQGIVLEVSLKVEIWLDTKKAYQAHGRTITPARLTFSQMGKNIDWTFPWDAESRWYVGLPRIEMKHGGAKKDTTARDAKLDEEIEAFINRVQVIEDEVKGNRAPTEAEKMKAAEQIEKNGAIEEDVPF